MRRLRPIAGIVGLSFLLAGCGGAGGESTATPSNLQVAGDAAKKLQRREAAAKSKAAPTPPAKAQ